MVKMTALRDGVCDLKKQKGEMVEEWTSKFERQQHQFSLWVDKVKDQITKNGGVSPSQ